MLDDGPLCDLFLERFKKIKAFDFETHGLNPLPASYAMRRRLPGILWDNSGKDTLRVRDGKRALRNKLKANNAKRFDKLPFNNGDADREAADMVDELMDSPVLSKVLTKRPPRFLLSGSSVVVRMGELEDFDRTVLGSLFALLYPGNVIISDFGQYARDLHIPMMRKGRLSIGLNNLEQLDKRMQQAVLQIPTKIGRGCTYDDAVELAQIGCKFPPGTMDYNAFIAERMRG
ncbi:hypothetical protein XI02_42110 [Bradyrhizobium sp. CCBAU 21365]|nr:hypothetical protein XI02_42110 [Bradyrhizobium sp. CCBAU 21365]